MLKTLRQRQKGFTLVEILIVVALIAILAVVALITINPAEAQRRARDTQRLKDISTLQSIVEQYLSDNPSTTFTTDIVSSAGTFTCDANWIGLDLCSYANTVPIDPANRSTIVAGTAGSAGGNAYYEFILDATGQYRICTRFESQANIAKATSDGGQSDDYFEIYSYTGVTPCDGS